MADSRQGPVTPGENAPRGQRVYEAPTEGDRVGPGQPEGSVRSDSSTASAVVIARLEEQLRERDAQMNEMREALRAVGILGGQNQDNRVVTESEGESRAPRSRAEVVIEEKKGESFKAFMSCKPPSFGGGDDPLVCMRWVRKMEQTFDSGSFSEGQKVSYAVRMLEGEALDWWDSVNQSLSAEIRGQLTWMSFVEKLNARFCSSGAIQRFERDFTNLVKRGMSIAKYNTAFIEKLQFAHHMCPTEESLVNRYVERVAIPLSCDSEE